MIEFLKTLAVQAGLIALADLHQLKSSNIHTKATAADMVTDTDKKVEYFIVSRLQALFPGCGFFGEETGKTNSDREDVFIIDPIDGTASFIHNLPNWCVSIGYYKNGKPSAGVVYQPVTNDLYYAEAGKGAFLNGVQIHVSNHTELIECIVGTGFSCLRDGWKEENNLPVFCKIAPLVQDIRKYGSAALDCCHVATGSLDACWEFYLQPYDIGAGILIAQEAGGTGSDFYGGSNYPGYGFLLTNSKIHEKMLSFFKDYKHLQK